MANGLRDLLHPVTIFTRDWHNAGKVQARVGSALD